MPVVGSLLSQGRRGEILAPEIVVWVSQRVARMRAGALTSPRRGLRDEGAPAAEGGDLARAADIGGLDDETLDAAAVGEPHRADRQRRRDRGDEVAERRGRQR